MIRKKNWNEQGSNLKNKIDLRVRLKGKKLIKEQKN